MPPAPVARAMTARERRVWLALWPLGAIAVVLGDLGWWINGIEPDETYVLDVAVGAISIVAGLIAWSHRPGNRIGPLLVLAGFLWAIPGIRGFKTPVAAGIGDSLAGVQDLVFAHLLLAYPTGRLASRWLRRLVVAGYCLVPVRFLWVMTIETTTVGTENPLALWNAPEVHDGLEGVVEAFAAIYVVTAVAIFSSRLLKATPAGRHMYAPVLGAALLFILALLFENVTGNIVGHTPQWALLPTVVARIVIPCAFLYGLMRSRVQRFGVADLAALGARTRDSSWTSWKSPRRRLREALAETLHDPSLELAYWLHDQGVFVDAAGRRIELPPDDGPRVATLIERESERLGAIIHDRALLEDPRLVETVSATAGLLLENERLQAEVQAQLEEVRASRARLVEAADAERRRVERDLHDGAQQRLVTLSLALGLAREQAASNGDGTLSRSLAESSEEVARALTELRELGRGLHPTILTEAGLGPALESLAERSTVPATVLTAPSERLPQAVEAGAYFIASEALANVAKHADASHVTLSARHEDGVLHLEIADDGIGGADPAGGSGLTGLEDRAAALGGRLRIESQAGSGTRIVAEIPCE